MSNVNNLGMGVMLGYLGGNEETVNAVKSSTGKEIEAINIVSNELQFIFSDGTGLKMWDDGQSCCESRYMRTDDDLTLFIGDTLQNLELVDGPNQNGEYDDVHEVQFLNVTTNKGTFQLSNHNEHNGYYGGFWISAKLFNPTENQ